MSFYKAMYHMLANVSNILNICACNDSVILMSIKLSCDKIQNAICIIYVISEYYLLLNNIIILKELKTYTKTDVICEHNKLSLSRFVIKDFWCSSSLYTT